MKLTTSRYFDGIITGTMQEGHSLAIRATTPLSLSRDTDGSWLAYVMFNDSWDKDATSKELIISDPAACRAFDALFELIADPVEFKGEEIEPPAVQELPAAD